jgi:DNA-binding MarR family transcriptional regulator
MTSPLASYPQPVSFFSDLRSCKVDMRSAVDYSSPVESLIPGARGKVLAALLRLDSARTVGEVARLAGVSRDRAGTVVAELEQLGLVERRRAGRAWLVTIVEESPVIEALRHIEDVRERTLDKLRAAAAAIEPRPAWMALYGSWAHGTARAGSDLDVAVIAQAGGDRERFDASVEQWSTYAERVTGLVASLVVADDGDDAVGPLWETIRREGVVLVDEVVSRAS